MEHIINFFKEIPVYLVYIAVAATGGMARYLNSFTQGGTTFRVGIFAASAFVAGFSGMMFALLGDSLHLPNPMSHIMAGVGGFFGDQTLKLVMEFISKKSLTVDTTAHFGDKQ